ncbi:MAG TPA: hypothetical protein VJK71_02585, partial [Gemmatimonadales bacterium]|nr:hypothetical protein [Gemmatimonadales bacterium]
LEATLPAGIVGGRIELQAAPGREVLVEGLKRQIAVVEELISQRVGAPIRVHVRVGGGGLGSRNQLIHNDLRASELERIRRLDPALNAAADELDLEIVDQSLPPQPPSA